MVNEALTAAENNAAIARAKYELAIAAGKRTAARVAAEDLEFWSNKAAFLFHAKVA